jgi:hypothetical protein
MHKFPIAQIDRRSGKDQVKEIFGAKPLEDIRFSLTSKPRLHPLTTDFSKTFDNFKPYILVFRLHKPSFSTELNHLKRLKIVLCTSISANYKFDDQEGKIQLNPYEHIKIESTVYLLLGDQDETTSISDLKKDLRFSESLAEIVTWVLKVEENLTDYLYLFGKDRSERDFLIQRILDDPNLEKLKQAKENIVSLTDMQKEFWQCVLEAKGSRIVLAELTVQNNLVETLAKELKLKEPFLKEIFEGLYYDSSSTAKWRFCHFLRPN